MADIILNNQEDAAITLGTPETVELRLKSVAQPAIVLSGGLTGAKGEKGDTGATGATGAPGQGVPTGGTTGQVLSKIDGTNYNTQWSTPTTAPVTSVNGQTGAVSLTKSDVGLGNVDNTSDANKPISTATQTALNGKEPTITSGTTSQYWRGDKTWQTLDKTSVGLGNVDNTSDANKPVSTATQTVLNAKEDVANKSTTTTLGTSNTLYPTQNAVKTYVDTQVAAVPLSNYVLKAGDTMTGGLTLSSTAAPSGITIYNTADQTTNYERLLISTVSNVYQIFTANAGTGVTRNIRIGDSAGYLDFTAAASSGNPKFAYTRTASTTGSLFQLTTSGGAAMTGGAGVTQYGIQISPVINQTSTAASNMLHINPTVTAAGSGQQNLILAQTGGTDRFRVDSTGITTIPASMTQSSGNTATLLVNPNINQSSTAGYIVLDVNPSFTAVGSGVQWLARFADAGTTRTSFSRQGVITNTAAQATLSGTLGAIVNTANYTPASDDGSGLYMLSFQNYANYNSTVNKTVGGSFIGGIFAQTSVTNTGGTPIKSFDSFIQVTGGATVSAARGLHLRAPTVSSGTITTNYGIYIDNQKPTNVTTGYGIYFNGTGTTGYDINWNGDTNLYRGGTDLLKTDDTFQAASLMTSIRSASAATNALLTDGTVEANATSGAFNVTMFSPSAATAGNVTTIKKTDASANAVTVVGTIDGVANYSLPVQNKYVVLQVNTAGTGFIVIGNN